ncbi:hypothetical protein HER21_34545, partial [Pseudomonas sp. BGM005]|nr:hypothetical protein [Pseudomonas sp. BG5]
MAPPCEVRDGELTEGEGARGHETTTFMIKEENMAITTGFSLPGFHWRRGKQAWDRHTWLYVSVIIAVVL